MKAPSSQLPSVIKNELPPVSFKRGTNNPLDADFFKQQSKNAFKDFDDLVEEQPVSQPKDERSMQEVLREKREAAEKALQQSQNNVESVEERKKRLQAQRDILVKQK